jgi:hypothetical protein
MLLVATKIQPLLHQNPLNYTLKINVSYGSKTRTLPAETLLRVSMSSMRVSRSGVSLMYCMACCTSADTAWIHLIGKTNDKSKISGHPKAQLIRSPYDAIKEH